MSEKIFNNTLKPSQLRLAMGAAYRTKKSLMVWGAPGIGKSQLVQQFADSEFPIYRRCASHIAHMEAVLASGVECGYTSGEVAALKAKMTNQEENLVDFRLSQVEPTDLRGIPVPVTFYMNTLTGEFVPDHLVTDEMPVTKTTRTVWASPQVLTLPADWRGVVFMDEANGAMPIVQAAAYQLFLDRKIGEMKIPDGAFIVAAGNRETDGGVTFQLATPLADRMIHVELSPDLDEWILNFAMEAGVHEDVISYLRTRDSDFNTLSPNNKCVCRGSSPRSWVTVSDLIKDFEQFAGDSYVLDTMIEGTIGDEIAIRLNTHRKTTVKLVPAMEILNGKYLNANNIQGMDTSMHYALCSNLVYKMVTLNAERKDGKVETKDWNKYATNFFEFLDQSYGEGDRREMLMMAIKSIFVSKVFFNPTEVPRFREFGQKYNAMIKKVTGRA